MPDGGTDSGLDAPPGEDAGADDAGDPVDGGELSDGDVADATIDDAGPAGACVAFATALEAGLAADIGAAVAHCTRRDCFLCAFAGGAGTDCGAGGTLASCIQTCIADGDTGPCATDDSCSDPGSTCDVPTRRCSLDAAAEVNAAIARGDVDLA